MELKSYIFPKSQHVHPMLEFGYACQVLTESAYPGFTVASKGHQTAEHLNITAGVSQ